MVLRSLVSVVAALSLLSAGCGAEDCPDKVALTDFNATLYMGKWYEYAKSGMVPYEEGGVCVTAEYSLPSDAANITVVNSMKDNATMELNTTTGWAEFATDQHSEAKLKVHFPGSPVAGNYWVLSTDYANYSIVWSCAKHPGTEMATEISWILLRDVENANMTLEKVEEELKTLQLPMLNKYTKTEQSAKVCSGADHVVAAVLTAVMASLMALLH